MTMKSKSDFLKRVHIFSDLEPGDLEKLESRLVERDVEKNEPIVRRNETGEALYIVVFGEARAVLVGKSGREMVLSYFRRGDFFGEMAMIDNKNRSADVFANEETKLLVLRRDSFSDLIRSHPLIAIRIMSELCARIRRADEIIGDLALLDVYGRVARFFIELVKRDGRNVGEWNVLPMPPTQVEIAGITGTSRETVSRIFSEYRLRGVLKKSNGMLYLKRSLLKEIAGEDW